MMTEAEKQKSISILAGIVGTKAVEKAAKKRKLPVYRDLTAIQYDPDKEGHEKLEITSTGIRWTSLPKKN